MWCTGSRKPGKAGLAKRACLCVFPRFVPGRGVEAIMRRVQGMWGRAGGGPVKIALLGHTGLSAPTPCSAWGIPTLGTYLPTYLLGCCMHPNNLFTLPGPLRCHLMPCCWRPFFKTLPTDNVPDEVIYY